MTDNELDLQPFADIIFPTDNDLEVPTLRLDRQPTGCEIPFVCWGEQKRTYKMYGKGTLHFYTDDYRFGQSLFEHPEKVLQHNPANIVEPNYSLYNDTPIAFGIQQIYRKRFVARALQERGVNVFVDLNVANKFYALNMIGVPKGYRSFCTRGYEDRMEALEFEYNIAKSWAGQEPLFVVYGGGEKVKAWCREHLVTYATPIITIKNKIKSLEAQAKNIALPFGEDTQKLLADAKASMYNNQVLSFNNTKQIGE